MVKGGQNLPANVIQAREEMSRERLRYLEAMAIYCEAIAMVEEYQQAVSVANLGGIRDIQGFYPQLGLKNAPQARVMRCWALLQHHNFMWLRFDLWSRGLAVAFLSKSN
ncbi:hypothetical protein GOBAR_AA08987 [Gossypium barbadense]|uniref:Uncharacterized protein n=1 Tax=Gossypium barbadense TaxID=3634 RepID=A0A2P5Y7T3_GOSBA|nr:hypothetical protein GOBAR_AA08987 [Gossypium barbadense]